MPAASSEPSSSGNVAFGVLVVALSITVVTVTVVMFETLAWLMG